MKFGKKSEMDVFIDKPVCPCCLRHVVESCVKRPGRIYQQQRFQYGCGGYNMRLHKYKTKRNGLWRPWVEEEDDKRQIEKRLQNTSDFASFSFCGTPIQSPPQFQHPVKLVWPKKPYDYMYAEGERLLRDFPVQATLEFASESDTDTDSDSDSDSDVVDFDHMQSNDHENSMELQARA